MRNSYILIAVASIFLFFVELGGLAFFPIVWETNIWVSHLVTLLLLILVTAVRYFRKSKHQINWKLFAAIFFIAIGVVQVSDLILKYIDYQKNSAIGFLNPLDVLRTGVTISALGWLGAVFSGIGISWLSQTNVDAKANRKVK